MNPYAPAGTPSEEVLASIVALTIIGLTIITILLTIWFHLRFRGVWKHFPYYVGALLQAIRVAEQQRVTLRQKGVIPWITKRGVNKAIKRLENFVEKNAWRIVIHVPIDF
jgi:hypothetical protein